MYASTANPRALARAAISSGILRVITISKVSHELAIALAFRDGRGFSGNSMKAQERSRQDAGATKLRKAYKFQRRSEPRLF